MFGFGKKRFDLNDRDNRHLVGDDSYFSRSSSSSYDGEVYTLGRREDDEYRPKKRTRKIVYSNSREMHELIDNHSVMVLTLDGELRHLGIAIIMAGYKVLSYSPLIIRPNKIKGIVLPTKVQLVVNDDLLKFMFAYKSLGKQQTITNVLTLLKGVRDGVMPLLVDYLDEKSIDSVESTLLSNEFYELIIKNIKVLNKALGVSPLVLLGIDEDDDDDYEDNSWDVEWDEDDDERDEHMSFNEDIGGRSHNPSVQRPHQRHSRKRHSRKRHSRKTRNKEALYASHSGDGIDTEDKFDFSVPDVKIQVFDIPQEEDI